MKKLAALLLILCLFLCGCAVERNDTAYPDDADIKVPCVGVGRTIPADAVNPADMDGGERGYTDYRFAFSPRAALWGGYAFYECDPYENDPAEPKIYSLPLGEQVKPELVFNGELIGIYQNVLVTCDDESYYAYDLQKGGQWVKLQPAGLSTAWLEYSGVLYIFGYNSDGCYADQLELSTLNSTRSAVEQPVRKTLLEGSTLYCIAGGGLYQADLSTGSGKLLCETDENRQLDKAGDRILLRQSNRDPVVYDLKTGSSFIPKEFPEPFYQCCGINPSLGSVRDGVAIIGYEDGNDNHYTWYYDIATGTELTEAPPETDTYQLDNCSYTLLESGERVFQIGEKQYTLRALQAGTVGRFTADEYGVISLHSGGICTYNWKTQEFCHLLHYEILG